MRLHHPLHYVQMEFTFSEMSVTTGLAIYGAVVSTLALVWHVYRDVTDRGRLRVQCYIGNLVGGVGPPDSQDYLTYKITNIGRKPVMVTHAGGQYKGERGFMVIPRSLPLATALVGDRATLADEREG